MRGDRIKALILALWLWLPSLAALGTDQVRGSGAIFAVAAFSLLLLATPFVVLPRVRTCFLALTPFALLVAPYCYLTLQYHSVPGDALVSAALNTSLPITIQVLRSFGWIVLLVPLSLIAYVLLALNIDRHWRLTGDTCKKMAACMLMYMMLAMVSRSILAQTVKLPPMLEYSTASLSYPSGLALSLRRIYTKHNEQSSFTSVHGRSETGNEALLVVYVLGESLRPDHMGLFGYARNTTPRLSSMKGELLTFPDVASSGNWTNGAVPTLTTWDLGSNRYASIVQTYKEAGFRTAWLSNQNVYDAAATADVIEFGVDTQDFHFRTDANLLPMFTSFLHQAGPRQFAVLHMMGSHIPYEERYGAASRVFTPTMDDLGIDAPKPRDKQAVVNSYDNTVVETDSFLDSVIGELRKESRPTIMVFTSDHGENLFDDERNLFMHTQRGPTVADIHVPLIVWMNQAYRLRFPQIAAALQANRQRKISHYQVFPTLLEAGGVAWDGRDPQRSFASTQFRESPRQVQLDLWQKIDYGSLR